MTAHPVAASSARRYERAPRRGEERRISLLEALEGLLERESLAKIGIADIAGAAGVTRSAFYFYFPTKAAAVAALLEGIYDELLEASARWHGADGGDGLELLRSSTAAVLDYTRRRPHILVAMFDAIASDGEVGEEWNHWRENLIERVALKIAAERRLGNAPEGSDPVALAAVLVGMNEQAMLSEVRALAKGDGPSARLPEAIVEVWNQSIYGPRA